MEQYELLHDMCVSWQVLLLEPFSPSPLPHSDSLSNATPPFGLDDSVVGELHLWYLRNLL